MTTELLQEYKTFLRPSIETMFTALLTPTATMLELTIVKSELDKLIETALDVNVWAMDMTLDEEEKKDYMENALKWQEKSVSIASLSEKKMETLCKEIDFDTMFKEEGK